MNCDFCGKESDFELCGECIKLLNPKRTTGLWEKNKKLSRRLALAYYDFVLKDSLKWTKKESREEFGLNMFCTGINLGLDVVIPCLTDGQLKEARKRIDGMIELRESKKEGRSSGRTDLGS